MKRTREEILTEAMQEIANPPDCSFGDCTTDQWMCDRARRALEEAGATEHKDYKSYAVALEENGMQILEAAEALKWCGQRLDDAIHLRNVYACELVAWQDAVKRAKSVGIE